MKLKLKLQNDVIAVEKCPINTSLHLEMTARCTDKEQQKRSVSDCMNLKCIFHIDAVDPGCTATSLSFHLQIMGEHTFPNKLETR